MYSAGSADGLVPLRTGVHAHRSSSDHLRCRDRSGLQYHPKGNRAVLRYFVHISMISLLLCLASCHKGDITLHTQRIDAHTTYDLNDVKFVNDSVGYIGGGSRYFAGVVLRTTDGGHSWSAADSVLLGAIYTMQFFSAQEGFVGGFYGHAAYTADSGKTFSNVAFSNLAINQLSFYGRQRGVAACGWGYKSGPIYNTSDGGATWQQTFFDSLHTFIGCAYLDDSTVVVCGYGTVVRSTNGGRTYRVVRENGDFYQNMKFVNSTGYAVGYQGEIIKSTDGGQTWRIVKGGNGLFGKAEHLMGVDFHDENNGYAVGESGLMVHTSDGGLTWQTVRPFTGERLRGVYMFTTTSGMVVGGGGSVYLFQE